MGIVGTAVKGVVDLHHVAKALGGGPIERTFTYGENNIYPNALPTPQEILWAYRTGYIKAKACQGLLHFHGINWFPEQGTGPNGRTGTLEPQGKAWRAVFKSERPQPALGEVLQLVNRGSIDATTAHRMLHRQGFDDDAVRENLLELAKEIPGPSDLVRFAVRHVFEPDLIRKFRFYEEMPDAFEYWHAKQGLGYELPPIDYRGNGPEAWTWAKAHWWSHWVWVSPNQGYEMLFRLRPDGGPGGGPRDPSGEVFTEQDLHLLLRGNDYPPFFRTKLASIAHRVIGIRQLRQLNQLGLMDRKELVERFKDQGYNQRDADINADLVVTQNKVTKFHKETTGARGKVLGAYKVGVVSKASAGVQLYRLGMDSPEQLAAYDARPAGGQEDTALADPGIKLQLDLVDLNKLTEVATAAIAGLKQQYLKGRLDRAGADVRLLRLGITAPRRQQYLDLWDRIFTPDRKELSTSQVLRFYREGIVDEPTATQRLRNLGWDGNDAGLLLTDTKRSIALDQAKALLSAARTAAQRQRALEQAARAIRTEHNRIRSELSRHGTPAQLETWLIRGLIQPTDMVRRLIALDWPLADAQRKTAEAEQRRQEALEKAKKAKAKQPGSA